ncbi:lysozyme family protein [Geomonas ferrireducens]|uniref:hypothetical protein n=1 Tax=Geomonas ferrireducens TaxID=2570227 RepID=UPI0010A7AE1C|nr:hypothetical protein [Geomonas ferrireducens]
MANSRQPHFHRDPFQRPSLTPGPLGHNDAASPNAPRTLVGDTPGPLGMNDHADPHAKTETSALRKNQGGAALSSFVTIDEQSSEELLVKDPRIKALLDVIAYAEGANYDTMVRGEGSIPITDFSKHPNVIVTLNKSLKSTAAGRYQFLNSTWVGLEMPDFKPDSQDKAAIKLFKRRRMRKPLFVGDVEKAIRLGTKNGPAYLVLPMGSQHGV